MFIVIEGIDGAGCETQAKLVYEKLNSLNKNPILIKYPNYDNPIGRIIKDHLYKNEKLSYKEQFLLYAAQFVFDADKILQNSSRLRSNNNDVILRPSERSERVEKLQNILIADRYFTTTLCYQVLEGMDENVALRFAQDFGIIVPDYVFFLDVSVQTAVKRKSGEGKELNFREKDIEFIEKTYTKYQDLINRQVWTKWIKIDGERKPDEIAEDIVSVIANEVKQSH